MGLRGPIGHKVRLQRAKQRNGTSGVSGAHPVTNSAPCAPEGLSIEALVEWDRVTGLLRDRGALDGLDQAALHDYITCWRRLKECEAEIQTHGLMVEGRAGERIKNPAATLARSYRGALLAWCKEFGFTFSSRTRIGMPITETKEPSRFQQMANEIRMTRVV
jgi:P27 family predicted phage terminase small subunit